MPIPRSYTEITDRKFTNYKYELEDEEKLADWMENNVSSSRDTLQ
jgi:hypothetical protein